MRQIFLKRSYSFTHFSYEYSLKKKYLAFFASPKERLKNEKNKKNKKKKSGATKQKVAKGTKNSGEGGGEGGEVNIRWGRVSTVPCKFSRIV